MKGWIIMDGELVIHASLNPEQYRLVLIEILKKKEKEVKA